MGRDLQRKVQTLYVPGRNECQHQGASHSQLQVASNARVQARAPRREAGKRHGQTVAPDRRPGRRQPPRRMARRSSRLQVGQCKRSDHLGMQCMRMCSCLHVLMIKQLERHGQHTITSTFCCGACYAERTRWRLETSSASFSYQRCRASLTDCVTICTSNVHRCQVRQRWATASGGGPA